MENPNETLCGLGSWRPAFLQRLASKKVYMVFYGCLGIIQGMFFTYLSATLSTLERQFGMKSKHSAFLMSGNEMSQILFLFAMPLMVRVKRRPLWTAVGLGFSGLGCFMMAIPHWAETSGGAYHQQFDGSGPQANLSGRSVGTCGSSIHSNSLEKSCDVSGNRIVDWTGLVIVFLGILLTGIGNSVFYSFGIAYLDDNSSHENSPKMLGLTYTFRLLGPTLGFLLGSYCLKTYVRPDLNPGFEEGDPRWIGAWWMGYPIIGALILAFALPLSLFPQRLPKLNTDASKADETAKLNESETDGNVGIKETFQKATLEFWEAFKRLLKNKLFIYNFFSSLFYAFAFVGFGTFMPKYVEYQFRQKGSSSSTFAGGVGTASQAIGLLISGFLISRYKPSARFLSGWNVVIGFGYFGALIAFSVLGCPTSSVYGSTTAEGDINIWSPCNEPCGCPPSRSQPICSKDGYTNFYSPCVAGCKSYETIPLPPGANPRARPSKVYKECSCVLEAWRANPNLTLSKEWIAKDYLAHWKHPSDEIIDRIETSIKGKPIQEAVDGWCPVAGCDKVYKSFLIVMFILMILGSTGRIGNVIVALRCIAVEDKSLSMAFNIVFISLFALLPSPMVYGVLIDSTCILWQKECGESTNCLLYDTDTLRSRLMLTTGFIMLVGVLFDVVVWYYSKSLVIFESTEKKIEEEEFDKYASNISLTRDAMFKEGGGMIKQN